MERKVLKNNAKEQLRGKWWVTIAAFVVLELMGIVIFGLANMVSEWLGLVAWIFVQGAVGFGMASYSLNVVRNKSSFTDIFDAFKVNVILKLLLLVFLLFILTLAVIIPSGIVYAVITNIFMSSGMNLSLTISGSIVFAVIYLIIMCLIIFVPIIMVILMFSQSFYIMIDNENLSAVDCMKKSVKMMKGHKRELFILYLSFLGWGLLIGTIMFATIFIGGRYDFISVFIIGIIITIVMGMFLNAYMTITYANYYSALKEGHEEQDNNYSEF